ncbi:MAG: S41 family peptidase [Gammaproteobacteria bacterium]|nr:MAG: S41 family peptidase [Gammaproteobacteria bacterium]
MFDDQEVRMSLKFRGTLVLVVGTALGLTLSLGGGVLAERQGGALTLPGASSAPSLGPEESRLLAEVMERVRRDYVEDIDDRRLIESAIRGMMTELDPHSQFLDAKEFEDIRISTTGNYSGVGLEVAVEEGRIRVVSPMDGTPAQRAGIQPGDVLVSIDQVALEGADLGEAVGRMRGRPGTRVSLGVLRADAEQGDELLTFDLQRMPIAVRSVRSEYLGEGYGYLRISHFSDTTGKDLRHAVATLNRLADGQLRGAVLDLRNNPGGVLDAAVDVADAFLDRGVIVSGDGRLRDARFQRRARAGDILDGASLVVLVNAGSASASEIVAGALKDHHRAILLGTHTFGKGSVQTVMPLSNGRAIKLTTSRYFTPSGASIHDEGIQPDVLVRQPADRTTPLGPEHLDDDLQLSEALHWLRSAGVMHSRAR